MLWFTLKMLKKNGQQQFEQNCNENHFKTKLIAQLITINIYVSQTLAELIENQNLLKHIRFTIVILISRR